MVPFRARVWVFETGVTHRLAGGELNRRRHECEDALRMLADARLAVRSLADLPPADLPRALAALPPGHGRRVRHVVTETARTRAAADALARGELSAVGELLFEGHRSLRDDYESSCQEADLLVDLAARHGAWGARLTGAGWGGAVIALIPAARAPRVVAEVQDGFRRETGRVPEVWETPASAGVRTERVRR
jgi:galactokinase